MLEELKKNKNIENFILDGEITCKSKRTNRFINFQELRKVADDPDKEFFYIAFDILYYNGNEVYNENLEKRKLLLYNNFEQDTKLNKIIPEVGQIIKIPDNPNIKNEIIEIFDAAKLINCEGVIIKELGNKTEYSFGKRNWHKVKSVGDVYASDTLDLIPIAGYMGKGMSNKDVFNSFLMAVNYKNSKKYISLCKLGTGFTHELLKEITERLSNSIIASDMIPENYIIPRGNRPNVFFKPTEVWEVGFDCFTISPSYKTGGRFLNVNENYGISVRFPRFMRFRPDKTVDEADTDHKIIETYKKLNSML